MPRERAMPSQNRLDRSMANPMPRNGAAALGVKIGSLA